VTRERDEAREALRRFERDLMAEARLGESMQAEKDAEQAEKLAAATQRAAGLERVAEAARALFYISGRSGHISKERGDLEAALSAAPAPSKEET
jgi:hypothetical protein